MAHVNYDRKTLRLLLGIVLVGFAISAFGHNEMLDVKFFYTGEFAQVYFSLLSGAQAKACLRGGILDLVFIHFYSSLIWYEFTRLLGQSRMRWAAMLPVGFDVIETVSIVLILLTGVIPNNLDWLGIATACKWTTGAIVFVWWLLLFFKRRGQAHSSL